MSARKALKEALVFAEDLIRGFFAGYKVSDQDLPPVSGIRYHGYVRAHYNEEVLRVVYFFALLQTKPYYKRNYLVRGYNALDFLHYCGKVAYESFRDFKDGFKEAGVYAIDSIATCLQEFIESGEFERHGGWSELKNICSKLCYWPAFCSVISIGNIYGQEA